MNTRQPVFRFGVVIMTAVFCFGWGPSTLRADVLFGPVVNPSNGRSYYLLDSDTWDPSEAEAVLLGGHLVTVNDQEENDWVFDTFANFDGTSRTLWTGYHRLKPGGPFVWVSGEPNDFENWFSGEPNNATGAENYAAMIPTAQFPPGVPGARQWFDMFESNVYLGTPIHGVVEVAITIPGDVNGDGMVNLLDVTPFVEAITSGTFIPAADINGDGFVNLLDVQPFVELLTG